MPKANTFSESVKAIIWGVLAILVAVWFVFHIAGNPLKELALIRGAEIAKGTLVDVYEDEQEDERGRVHESDVGVYAYRVSDGRDFTVTTRDPRGQLEQLREVEFLPTNPAVSRIKGDGCSTIVEFLWRKLLLGGVLLTLFVWPGVEILRSGIQGMMELRDNPRIV